MTPALYAHATCDALNKGLEPAKVFESLKATLTKRGHMSLYPKILKAIHARLTKLEKAQSAVVFVAKPGDEKTYEDAITAFLKEVGAQSHAVIVDETLVGGFVAQTTTKRTDQSYKESLLSIYRSIINE